MKKLIKAKLKANWTYIIVIIFVASFVAAGILIYLKWPLQKAANNQTTHGACLSDNETATFNIIGGQTTATSADVIISDKVTGKEKLRFQVDNLFVNHYHLYETHKCSIYIIKEFDFDQKHAKFLPGFRVELWQYKYDGKGVPILTFAGKDAKGQTTVYYEADFRIDFLETLMALIKGYLGDIDNFATIIKELETKKDVFSLKYKNITSKYPDIEGVFDFNGWTRDSHYFWGHIQQGANILAFFRIERDTWKVDILPAPEGTLGGTAFNPEYGYITYDTGPGWIGVVEVAEQVYDEWRKAGKKIDFYVYNLFTKEKTLLATIDDPSWSFQQKWISDTELEYELPGGEKKIYKINGQ